MQKCSSIDVNSTTLVTALYNIGRDDLTNKHRPFTKYLDWFKHILHINTPMVIFIPFELTSYVEEHRPSQYSTKIVVREFTELAAYQYHDKIQETIDTMKKESTSSYFSECPEFITAKYETILFSKFDFLKEVADTNPYKSKYFIWLDAGTFRTPPPFDVDLPWPDPYKIPLLGDKFLLANYSFDHEDLSPLKWETRFLRSNTNAISAYILGGNHQTVTKIHEDFWVLVNNALKNGVINNERQLLHLMCLHNPKDYYIWSRTGPRYTRIPIPTRDRMIPYELALGTSMSQCFPIDQRVKLLTLATKEIHSQVYEPWETTAKYYGYDYEILGRETSWNGSKIRPFYEKLQTITQPYAVVTDCTDLFFCGSAAELCDKFIELDTDVIVGSEMHIHYSGKKDKNALRAFFGSMRESEQAFPNTGFLMGRTESLRKLMELHLDYTDDQAAVIDTIYDNKFPVTIDYHTTLVGNIPKYKVEAEAAIRYFELDEDTRRYRNVHSHEYPIVLHFPGKHWNAMRQFYHNTGPTTIATLSEADPNGLWIFIIIVAIVVILIFLLNYVNGLVI